ncbi:MAG TPA: DMT family transporter, partial [Hymenobacter sp.]
RTRQIDSCKRVTGTPPRMNPHHAHQGSLAKALPLIVVLSVVWGTNWALFPLAVREISVWTFRAICLFGSGAFLLLIARARGISLHVPPQHRLSLGSAALAYLVVWNVGSTYAAILIPSGQAAILGFTMPVWTTLFSWLLLGEKPSKQLIFSVFLAAAGVAFLVIAARQTYASAPLGFFLGIAAGIGWACGTLILKRAAVSVPVIVSTGWQLLTAGVPLLIAAVVLGSRELFVPSLTTLVVIGYITIVPMALGNIAWFSIADMMPATVSGLSIVMVPMVAMVSGAVINGEPLGVFEIGAMLCCGTSLLLVLLKPNRPT